MTRDHLSTTFAALADPTRRAILALLAQGEATVNELAEPFALSLPTISKHLKVLQRAGLVSQGQGTVATMSARDGAATRRRQVDGGLSPVLGRELRPAG